MSKPNEVYEAYVSDEGNVFHFSNAVKWEVHQKRMPIGILRIRRAFDKMPSVSHWFKSPKKLKTYVPIRITVEYL
jgi:hypothetical protein